MPRHEWFPLYQMAKACRARGGVLGAIGLLAIAALVIGTLGALLYIAKLDTAKGTCPRDSICGIFRTIGGN